MPHIGEFAPHASSNLAPTTPTVSASPYTYTAIINVVVVITGGVVTLIEYGRHGVYTAIGVTSGQVFLRARDSVRITYAVAPTVTVIPL